MAISSCSNADRFERRNRVGPPRLMPGYGAPATVRILGNRPQGRISGDNSCSQGQVDRRLAGPWRGLQIFWTPARRIRIDKGAINTGA
jgi:hypothetical protein